MPGSNLVFGMGVLAVSGIAVWSGITNPEGGVFVGLRAALAGEPVTRRQSSVGAKILSDYSLSPTGGTAGPTGGGIYQGNADLPAVAGGSTAAPTGVRAAILAEAKTWLGVKYVYGGNTKSGVDCSGFTKAVYGKVAGVDLPRVSFAQALTGTSITAAQALPGDLVAFGAPVHHVAIYVGRGQIIHAPHTGAVVRYETIWTYEPVFYRRLVADKPAAKRKPRR